MVFSKIWQCLGLAGRVDSRLYERGRAEVTPIIKIPFLRFVSSNFFGNGSNTSLFSLRDKSRTMLPPVPVRAKRLFS